MMCLRYVLVVAGALAYTVPAMAQTVIVEWDSVKAPPAPALKPVAVDAKTTALLIFDMTNQFCGPRYAHCPEMVPTLKKMLTEARTKNVLVVYTSIPSVAKTEVVKAIEPSAADLFFQSFLDKFLNTDLEKTLKDKGISTLIMTGLAANGAVLYTASEAAQKGFNVVVPVDGITAMTRYAEQFTVWQLGNAPVISPKISLTKSDMVKF